MHKLTKYAHLYQMKSYYIYYLKLSLSVLVNVKICENNYYFSKYAIDIFLLYAYLCKCVSK